MTKESMECLLAPSEPCYSRLPESIRKKLSKGNACFVVITCASPDKNGDMQVEMTYEGDADLAAFLIERAQEQLADAMP